MTSLPTRQALRLLGKARPNVKNITDVLRQQIRAEAEACTPEVATAIRGAIEAKAAQLAAGLRQ